MRIRNIMMLSLIVAVFAMTACAVTEGDAPSFDELGYYKCTQDADCGEKRYCNEDGYCANDCRRDADCYLFAPSGMICTDQGRCLYEWEMVDGDGEEGGEGEGEGEGELTNIECTKPADCSADKWPEDCGNRQCFDHGYRYTCDPSGKCRDNKTVDFGTPASEDSPANDYVGVWGLLLPTGARTSDIPLVGFQDTVSINHYLVRIRHDGNGGLVMDETMCFLRLKNYYEEPVSKELGWMVIPQNYINHVPVVQQHVAAADLEPLEAGKAFKTDRMWEVRGVHLDDPVNDVLPVRADVDAGDTRVWDQDKDGAVGMTTEMQGVLTGQVYSDQRWSQQLTGEIVDANKIAGECDPTYEQHAIGASSTTLLQDSATSMVHPEGRLTYFRMLRLDDNATCDDVMEMANKEQGNYLCWTWFEDDEECVLFDE